MPQTASVAIISSRCTNALTGLEQGMHFWLLEKGKNRRTTIKTSSRVEKCASVEKQVSASGGTSSAWVIDCPNQPRGSRARPRLDLLRFKKWICLVGEAYFFPAFRLLIVGKEAAADRELLSRWQLWRSRIKVRAGFDFCPLCMEVTWGQFCARINLPTNVALSVKWDNCLAISLI